jgi:hypothetical protein
MNWFKIREQVINLLCLLTYALIIPISLAVVLGIIWITNSTGG